MLILLNHVKTAVSTAIICSCVTLLHNFNAFTRRGRRRKRKPKSLKEKVHDEQLPMMTSPTDPVEMQRLNLETEGTVKLKFAVHSHVNRPWCSLQILVQNHAIIQLSCINPFEIEELRVTFFNLVIVA